MTISRHSVSMWASGRLPLGGEPGAYTASEDSVQDEVMLTLEARGRDVQGATHPLSVDELDLERDTVLLFKLPLDHMLLSTQIITGVTSSIKWGGGFALEALKVGADRRSVIGRVRIDSNSSVNNLGAIQFTLNNGDRWECNVPIWVDDQ